METHLFRLIFFHFLLTFTDFLATYRIVNNHRGITPRGLINQANHSHINAILQTLLGCPPFYHLVNSIPLRQFKGNTPTIDAMAEFVRQFTVIPWVDTNTRKKKKKDDVEVKLVCDPAFEPSEIYKLWNAARADNNDRHVEAEDFVEFILNKLNDEMLEVYYRISQKFMFLSFLTTHNTL